MTNYFKIKSYWSLIIGMVLCSVVTTAQELSDQEIGLDVERITVLLKEHGVKDEDLDREIAMMREQYKYKYQVQKKYRNEALQKIESEQKAQIATNNVITDIPESEKQALQTFYNSTNGAGWANNKGWDFSKPVKSYLNDNGSINPDGWLGITVRNGHVQVLSLDNNKLSGIVPAQIGQLTELTHLWLNENQLTGSIPVQIGQLKKLKSFSLHTNQLEGNIPIEMSQLSQLSGLEVSYNKLSGSIPDLTGLNKLSWFRIAYNNFRFVDFAAQYPTYRTNARYFRYEGQAKTDTEKTITVTAGNSVTLTMCEDGRFTSNDTYQWYKGISPDGVLIPGATARQYILSNLIVANAGNYYCLSKHPQITDPNDQTQNLVLERNPIHLSIINCTPIQGSIQIVK